MGDVVVVTTLIGFFAVTVAYVRACELLARDQVDGSGPSSGDPEEAAR